MFCACEVCFSSFDSAFHQECMFSRAAIRLEETTYIRLSDIDTHKELYTIFYENYRAHSEKVFVLIKANVYNPEVLSELRQELRRMYITYRFKIIAKRPLLLKGKVPVCLIE